MNKTVKVNLGGYVFQLDEDAYELLRAYLHDLERQFEASHEGKEIIEDIERRIAELLVAAMQSGREVLGISDIKQVVDTIGQPHDFATEDSARSSKRERVRGKLYRETSDVVIGGVAAGLARHLGVNAVWVRLAFLLFLVAWTFGFWAYLVLWLIIPQNPIAGLKPDERNVSPFVALLNSLFALIGKIFAVLVRSITVVLGLALVLLGFPLLMAFVGVSVFPSFDFFQWEGQSLVDVYDFFEFAIVDNGSAFVVLLMAMVVLIPLLMLSYWGVRLLFRVRVRDGALHLGVLFAWVGAVVLLGVFSAGKVISFRTCESDFESVQLASAPDTLWLLVNDDLETLNLDAFIKVPEENIAVYYDKDRSISYGLLNLTVCKSENEHAYFKIRKEVCASSEREALRSMDEVTLQYSNDSTHLVLSNVFKAYSQDKPWVPSMVKVYLFVPKDAVLVVSKMAKQSMLYKHDLQLIDNEIIYID